MEGFKVSKPPLMTSVIDSSGKINRAWGIWFRDLYKRTAQGDGNLIDFAVEQAELSAQNFEQNTSDMSQNAQDIVAIQKRLPTVVTITSGFTVDIGSFALIADSSTGSIVVTLPDAANANGYEISVTKTSILNTVSIVPTGVNLIAGATTQHLYYENEVLNFISDGTNWVLVS